MAKIIFEDLILFEDENYLVLNKPPFVSSLEDRASSVNIYSLANYYHDNILLCHRLDKETSGCLILAKGREAFRGISSQFLKRNILKKYHALSEGVHNFKNKQVDIPIYSRSRGLVRTDVKLGKPSTTIFNTMKAYRKYTLLEARPLTGRMHQIRVHLASLNAPIAGDNDYGGHPFYLSSIKRNYKSGKWKEEQPLIKRVALHAAKIGFVNLKGKAIEVEAPYPKDFRALVRQLDIHG